MKTTLQKQIDYAVKRYATAAIKGNGLKARRWFLRWQALEAAKEVER